LKQTSNQIKFPSYNMEKIRQATKEDRSPGRPTSLDRNQHRFKFMIDHLNSWFLLYFLSMHRLAIHKLKNTQKYKNHVNNQRKSLALTAEVL